MLSESRCRLFAQAVAIASIASIGVPFVLGIDGRLELAQIFLVGWFLVLGFGVLAAIWSLIVYRVVLLYLSTLASVNLNWSKRSRLFDLLMYGLFRPTLARQAVETTQTGVRQRLTPTKMILLSAAVGVIGSLSIASLTTLAIGREVAATPVFETWGLILSAAFVLVLLSPFIETLATVVVLELLRKRWGDKSVLPVVSGLAWGALHAAINSPVQFLPMVWLFWILSNLYLQTRPDHSFVSTCVIAFMAHAVNNLVIFTLILARQYMLTAFA